MNAKRVGPNSALVLLAIVAGVGLRLYLAYTFYGNEDQNSYDIVAGIMERGGNVYHETIAYNYAPTWSFCLLFLHKIANFTGLPLHFMVRGFLTIVDVFNAVLIGLIAAHVGSSSIKDGFSRYLLNPVALLIIGFHGQFDNFATLPLLLATYLYARRPDDPPMRWIWLLGTSSLLIKHITIFAVWTLFLFTSSNRRAVGMFGAAITVFLLSFAPYVSEGASGILRNVFLYQAQPTGYGIGILLPRILGKLLFIGLMLLLPYLAKRYQLVSPIRAMELSAVAFLGLTYGFAEQYLIMPVIWGSIFATTWYWAYSLTAAFVIAGSTNNIHLSFIPSIADIPAIVNIVWMVATGWLLSYFLTVKTSSETVS